MKTISKPEHILVSIVPDTYRSTTDERFTAKPGCVVTNDHMGLLSPENIAIVQREMAETNPNFKQLIPYVMLRNPKGEYLQYKRLGASGEKRLVGKTSIGFGGHIDALDVRYDHEGAVDLMETVGIAASRELREELDIVYPLVDKAIGFILDDSTPVGRVHVGLLFVIETGDSEIYVSPESGIDVQGWVHPDDLLAADAEDWSKASIMHLIKEGH